MNATFSMNYTISFASVVTDHRTKNCGSLTLREGSWGNSTFIVHSIRCISLENLTMASS